MKKKINNGIFYAVISLVAVLAIGSAAVIGYSGYGTPKVVVEGDYIEAQTAQTDGLGAVPSPDVFQKMNFHLGFNRGGLKLSTTSTASTYTLAAGDIDYEDYFISWLPNVSTTITTMASNTPAMDDIGIPVVGDTREFILYNASTTVASTITLAAGDGVDLQKNEDTANLATAGTSATKLTFIRKPDTDVMIIMEEFDVAD